MFCLIVIAVLGAATLVAGLLYPPVLAMTAAMLALLVVAWIELRGEHPA